MLKEKLPNCLQIYDKIFDIKTNARLWINISLDLEKTNYKEISILTRALTDIKQLEKIYINKLINRLFWFLNLGKTIEEIEENNKKVYSRNTEKLYSFEKDAELIYSAFYRTYGIDIEKEIDNIHWWKFMALFNDLDNNTKFVGFYMYYRSLDINTSPVYKHADAKEKQRILEIKKYVSLNENSFNNGLSDREINKIQSERNQILNKGK